MKRFPKDAWRVNLDLAKKDEGEFTLVAFTEPRCITGKLRLSLHPTDLPPIERIGQKKTIFHLHEVSFRASAIQTVDVSVALGEFGFETAFKLDSPRFGMKRSSWKSFAPVGSEMSKIEDNEDEHVDMDGNESEKNESAKVGDDEGGHAGQGEEHVKVLPAKEEQ